MALIDDSYFVGELNIPTSTPGVKERLSAFIDTYQAKLLEDLLGYPTYKAFKAALEGETSEAPLAAPWDGLRDGAEYTDRFGRLVKWPGMKWMEGGAPKSGIAYFTYYHWLRDQHTQATAVGMVEMKTESAVRVAPTDKMLYAWNEMNEWINALFGYLQQHPTDYPDWRAADVWLLRSKYQPLNRFGI